VLEGLLPAHRRGRGVCYRFGYGTGVRMHPVAVHDFQWAWLSFKFARPASSIFVRRFSSSSQASTNVGTSRDSEPDSESPAVATQTAPDRSMINTLPVDASVSGDAAANPDSESPAVAAQTAPDRSMTDNLPVDTSVPGDSAANPIIVD
jgi:hypothetical protein